MTSRPHLRLPAAALGLLAALCAAAPARAANTTYSAIYAFGDSLSDVGNAYLGSNRTDPPSPPYSNGRYSNGPVWEQSLASSVGVKTLTPSLQGGTVFAYGGATASGHSGGSGGGTVDLSAQLQQYTAKNGNAASASALFTLDIGVNDVLGAVNAGASSAAVTAVATQAAVDTMSVVSQLLTLGARHIMVTTLPDVAHTPSAASMTSTELAALAAGLKAYSTSLAGKVAALKLPAGAKVSVLDIYTLLDGIVAQPASMGFTNVKDACLTNMSGPAGGIKTCASTKTGQDKYLWWDAKHPTEHGHQAIAAQALLQLP